MWLLIDQWWWWGEVDNDDDDEVDNDDDDEVDNDDDGVDDDDDEVDNDDNDDDDNEANLEAKNHLPRSLAGWPALIKTQIEAHFLQPPWWGFFGSIMYYSSIVIFIWIHSLDLTTNHNHYDHLHNNLNPWFWLEVR